MIKQWSLYEIFKLIVVVSLDEYIHEILCYIVRYNQFVLNWKLVDKTFKVLDCEVFSALQVRLLQCSS